MAAVLVVNAGSVSLKLSVVGTDGETRKVSSLAEAPGDVEAVAHRVVHGGSRFRESVLVDDAVELELAGLTELAPLHNTPALEAIREARRAFPQLPHVAVFDTAFHQTIPDRASTYALPLELRELGIRRFGFHGLSVQWASEQVPVPRLVVCHLGGGCSVTAVRDGRSVDTTMGFTPLEGVPMATRAGSVDPGALVYLLRHHLSVDEPRLRSRARVRAWRACPVSRETSASSSTPRWPAARLALDVFTYRVSTAVGAMAVALDGLDALVFTAGIGENSAAVREAVCSRLEFLGVELDPAANASAQPDAVVSASGSAVRVIVLEAREDLVAAREARRLLQ